MNRRDLLKLIGIGGVGAVATVVGGKEAEAAPVVEAPKPVMVQGTPQLPGWEWIGSSRVLENANYYSMGTAMISGRVTSLYLDFGGDE